MGAAKFKLLPRKHVRLRLTLTVSAVVVFAALLDPAREAAHSLATDVSEWVQGVVQVGGPAHVAQRVPAATSQAALHTALKRDILHVLHFGHWWLK